MLGPLEIFSLTCAPIVFKLCCLLQFKEEPLLFYYQDLLSQWSAKRGQCMQMRVTYLMLTTCGNSFFLFRLVVLGHLWTHLPSTNSLFNSWVKSSFWIWDCCLHIIWPLHYFFWDYCFSLISFLQLLPEDV